MKTTQSLRIRLMSLTLAASLSGLLMTGCTKESIEPSLAGQPSALRSGEQQLPEPIDLREAKKSLTKPIATDELLMMEVAAPAGQAAFQVQISMDGKVRFNGTHDVQATSAEIILSQEYMSKIRELMMRLDRQRMLDSKRKAGEQSTISETTFTLTTCSACSQTTAVTTASDKMPNDLLELQDAIFKGAQIDRLIRPTVKPVDMK